MRLVDAFMPIGKKEEAVSIALEQPRFTLKTKIKIKMQIGTVQLMEWRKRSSQPPLPTHVLRKYQLRPKSCQQLCEESQPIRRFQLFPYPKPF
jgi:hypothetical protein